MMEQRLLNFSKWVALTIAGICFVYPFVYSTKLMSLYITIGVIAMIFTWVLANLEKGESKTSDVESSERRSILVGLAACTLVAVGLMYYYEAQMPKYSVALSQTDTYKVPKHLSKNQLKEMGAECNTYGDTNCSVSVFARLVDLDPRDLQSLANLAMAQSHKGQHLQASMNFQQAIKRGYATFDLFQFYGDSLAKLGRKKQAVKAYEQALMLNPDLKTVKDKLLNLKK